MEIKVVAKGANNLFMGEDTNGDFCIFQLDGRGTVEMDDILQGVFDDSDGLRKTVTNFTQQCNVRIYLDQWSCARVVALDRFRRLNAP